MPKDNIDRAVKRVRAMIQKVIMKKLGMGYGPAGVAIIVEALTIIKK